MKILLCIALVSWVSWGEAAKIRLPPYIKTCPRKNPSIDKCDFQSAKTALAELVKGDKKYGIPTFKPLVLKGITVNNGQLLLKLLEVNVYGIEEIVLKDFKMDPEKQTFDLEAVVPKLKLVGKYQMDGRILIIPLTGKGDFWIECDQVHVTAQLFYNLITRNGEEHMEFDTDKKKADITMQKASLWFYDLFNGNEALGNSTNQVLNDEWPKVLEEIKPALTETVASVAFSVFNNIGHKVPYKYFFSDT